MPASFASILWRPRFVCNLSSKVVLRPSVCFVSEIPRRFIAFSSRFQIPHAFDTDSALFCTLPSRYSSRGQFRLIVFLTCTFLFLSRLFPPHPFVMSHRSSNHRRTEVQLGVLDVSDTQLPFLDAAIEVREGHGADMWDPERTPSVSYDRCSELDALVPPIGPEVPRALTRYRPEGAAEQQMSSGSSSTRNVRMPTPNLSTVKKQRPKQYKRREPSRFCHLCGRRSPNVPMAICSRVMDGMCRKVVCEYCFEKHGWDRTVIDDAKRVRERKGSELDTVRGRKAVWECPHCQGICGYKAQCKTYGRTNYKRHLRLRDKRNEQETSKKLGSESKKQGGSSRKMESGSKKHDSGGSRRQEGSRHSSK